MCPSLQPHKLSVSEQWFVNLMGSSSRLKGWSGCSRLPDDRFATEYPMSLTFIFPEQPSSETTSGCLRPEISMEVLEHLRLGLSKDHVSLHFQTLSTSLQSMYIRIVGRETYLCQPTRFTICECNCVSVSHDVCNGFDRLSSPTRRCMLSINTDR